MTMRRYLIVRTVWSAGALFAFVSLAYLFVWVFGSYRGDPGYGGFLWDVLRGSLGRTAARSQAQTYSVDSIAWTASTVTLSLLLVTAVFTLVLAVLFALVSRRSRAARVLVRAFEFLGVSLLPLWTALLISYYFAYKGHVLHVSGYCGLHSSSADLCRGPVDWAAHLVWPALTLTLFFAAIYARVLRHDLAQAEDEHRRRVEDGEDSELVRRDLVRFYGVGLAKRLGRDLGFALGFAFFAELAFALPGLSRTFFQAHSAADAPTMAGILVWASVLAAAGNLLVDVACAALDPRFRRF